MPAQLKAGRWWNSLGDLKQRFIFTASEKRVIAFVLAAFLLGLGVKHYRETHPVAGPDQEKAPAQKMKRPDHKRRSLATPKPDSSEVVED